MIILTHPCAGKTYWAKRDKRIKDIPTNKRVHEGIVVVTLDHEMYDKYDAAVIIPDYILNGYIEKRQQTETGKVYNTHEKIYEHRGRVIRYARKQGLTVYSSIEEVLK